MDTQLIYNYLTDLKIGYCDTLEEYQRKIIKSEIEFRAAFTQYLAETSGKGTNLILNDFLEFDEAMIGLLQEKKNDIRYEQFAYAAEKTREAVEYIRKAKYQFSSGEDDIRPQRKIKVEATDERVISGTEGLAKFLGCGKSMAFAVIKSGILKECGIQYKVGNCWKFNAERLQDFIRIHPNFLSEIRCVR